MLAIGGSNWIINEIIVRVHLSRLDVSTTRQELIDRLGEPDWVTRWLGESSAGGAGDIFVYRYPYLWDFLLPLRETRTIEVQFRDGDDQLIEVGSHPAYSDGTTVVVSRRM